LCSLGWLVAICSRLIGPIKKPISGARHWGSPGTNNPPPAGRRPRVRVRVFLGGQEMSK
jgi:hypothetical protein